MNKIEKVVQFVKEHSDELRWIHTKDVVKTALTIAERENADKEIVEISAWLHDVGFWDKRAEIITHHIYSLKMAEKILKELNFEPKKIERILQCIKEHMGPENSEFLNNLLKEKNKNWNFLPRPSTKESKAVYDADMINLCSPFGVAKIIFLNAKQNKDFKETIAVTRILATQAFNDLKTKSGKKIGNRYFSVGKEFLDAIKL